MKNVIVSIAILCSLLSFSQTEKNTQEELLASANGNHSKTTCISKNKSLTNCKTPQEEASVKKALNNYINGSSYNKLAMLKSAFAENATLYLTMKDGEFKKLAPEDYVGFFKKGTPNKFNGRVGKILDVAIVKDIATAKVEILFSKGNLRYIDLFLLKKIDSEWKIISKTATKVEG